MSQRMTDMLHSEPVSLTSGSGSDTILSGSPVVSAERRRHTMFLTLFIPLVILLLTII